MKAKEYVARFEATLAEGGNSDDSLKKALGELGNGLRKELADLTVSRGKSVDAAVGAIDEMSMKYAAIRKRIRPEGILREDGFERLLDHISPGIVTMWKFKKLRDLSRGGKG